LNPSSEKLVSKCNLYRRYNVVVVENPPTIDDAGNYVSNMAGLYKLKCT
jgi:hypothetical protein